MEAARYADMFAALGAEAHLRIVRSLLAAHPQGTVVGDLPAELGIPGATLSHQLEKRRHEGLVISKRDRQFLLCRVNTEALRDLLQFLYAECCTRSAAVNGREVLKTCS